MSSISLLPAMSLISSGVAGHWSFVHQGAGSGLVEPVASLCHGEVHETTCTMKLLHGCACATRVDLCYEDATRMCLCYGDMPVLQGHYSDSSEST